MTAPLVLQLDERLKHTLEREATRRGLSLGQLVPDLLEEGLRHARRRRIRADSARVGDYVASSPDALSLFEDIGGAHMAGTSE
ncbi:hypothetical protein GOB93_15585 [Acetobacter musti]|uniref:Ribbon-helix-helix protein CopG domain-containing protein n=1 Tax=Acetobacter musti TaxID=864732 RepID=A0ABX0JTB9_9PROT|nr:MULTISPECIES: hypothetical protein [Acetobacter]NHN86052.1 hypothetical protein [Acetobacter musti]NHN93708.1 hypothetical protein [Acetobacter sicerae]